MSAPIMRRPQGAKGAWVGLFGHWKTSTLVGACAATGSSSPRCRPTVDETFRTCVEKDPAPAPELGEIQVTDSAGCRKSDAVCWAIEDRGAEPRFSRCSPDPARSSGVRQVQALVAKSQGAEPKELWRKPASSSKASSPTNAGTASSMQAKLLLKHDSL